MAADHKLDIFRVLDNVDSGNRGFLEGLDDDEKKAFVPLVAMRWASSVNDHKYQEHFLTMINELVNVHFWTLTKHPELQWLLMSMVGFGVKQRHAWIPNAKKGKTSSLIGRLLRHRYPTANDNEMVLMARQNTDDELLDYAKALAWDDKEIKALKAELKKRHG